MIQDNDGAPDAERDDHTPPDRHPSWTEVFGSYGRATIEERAQHRDTKKG